MAHAEDISFFSTALVATTGHHKLVLNETLGQHDESTKNSASKFRCCADHRLCLSGGQYYRRHSLQYVINFGHEMHQSWRKTQGQRRVVHVREIGQGAQVGKDRRPRKGDKSKNQHQKGSRQEGYEWPRGILVVGRLYLAQPSSTLAANNYHFHNYLRPDYVANWFAALPRHECVDQLRRFQDRQHGGSGAF